MIPTLQPGACSNRIVLTWCEAHCGEPGKQVQPQSSTVSWCLWLWPIHFGCRQAPLPSRHRGAYNPSLLSSSWLELISFLYQITDWFWCWRKSISISKFNSCLRVFGYKLLGLSIMPKKNSPSLLGLAEDWEKDKSIRALVRANNGLLAWPSKKSTGVPSMASLGLNHRLITYAALLWLPQNPKPKTLSVDLVKAEVGVSGRNIFTTIYNYRTKHLKIRPNLFLQEFVPCFTGHYNIF